MSLTELSLSLLKSQLFDFFASFVHFSNNLQAIKLVRPILYLHYKHMSIVN